MPRQVMRMLSQMGSGLLMGQEEITASSLRRVVWLARGAGTSGYLLNNRGSFLFSIHSTGPRMGFFPFFSFKVLPQLGERLGRKRSLLGSNNAKPWEAEFLSVRVSIDYSIFYSRRLSFGWVPQREKVFFLSAPTRINK